MYKKVVKYVIFVGVFLLIVLTIYSSNINLGGNEIFIVNTINSIESELSLLDEEVDNEKKAYKDLEKKLEKLKKDIDELNKNNIEIKNKLDSMYMVCGYKDVRGPGITLRVEDNLSDDPRYSIIEKIVHDWDVSGIINDLNKYGAEAISVNGKRIISTTEIICIGPVIKINNEAVAAPFIIRAIGNSEELMNAVNDVNSYAYNIKNNYGINVRALENNDLYISKSRKKVDIEFAKTSVEE